MKLLHFTNSGKEKSIWNVTHTRREMYQAYRLIVFVYDLQKVYKEKFKCRCSERKIPKDASLSAFIRSKDTFEGWGQGLTDARSRRKHCGTHKVGRVLWRLCSTEGVLNSDYPEGRFQSTHSSTALHQLKSVSQWPINNSD